MPAGAVPGAPPTGLHEDTTQVPKTGRKLIGALMAVALLSGGAAALAGDVGGVRTFAETRFPELASVPVIGSGRVYANGLLYQTVEGGADVVADVQIMFSGPIDPATATRANVQLAGPGGRAVAAEVIPSESGRSLTISPLDSLEFESEYTISIGEGLLATHGAPVFREPAAEEPGAVFEFRTRLSPPDTEPPTLASSDPSAGAEDAARDQLIRLVFNEPLDRETVDSQSVQLLDAEGAPVAADISLTLDDMTIQLAPRATLDAGASYQVRLDSSISDRAGNRMAMDTLTFATARRRTQPRRTPPAAPATLNIRVRPEAFEFVKIELDGEDLGNPPKLNLEIASGRPHTLRLLGSAPFSTHADRGAA